MQPRMKIKRLQAGSQGPGVPGAKTAMRSGGFR